VTPAAHRRGPLFWLSAAVGWAIIGYGVRGLLLHHVDTRPSNLATFVVAGALLHDLVVAPILVVLGVVASRSVPARARAVVQAALIISACVALFSYPLVRGYAHRLHNPSSLPHNYTANLALVLGIVWAIAAVILGIRLHLRRRDS
jgi:hypothetical protein